MNSLNVIDVSALVYVGSTSEWFRERSNFGFPVGGIHFLLRQLCVSFVSSDSVVLCFDSPSFRSDLLTGYKAGRVHNPTVYSQLEFLYDGLMGCGIQCEKYDQYEADDIVSWAVEQNKGKYNEIVIVGNDHDLCHNVQNDVRFKSIDASSSFVHQGNFEENVDRTYTKFNTISAKKALCGCRSDSIPAMTLENGMEGSEVYQQYCDFLNEKQCYDWQNTSRWELLWYFARNQPYFSENDLKNLETRLNLTFPSACPEGVTVKPITWFDVNQEKFFKFLTMVNDYDSLKCFGAQRVQLSEDDKQMLRERAKSLANGEYAADKNLEADTKIETMNLDFFTKEF